MAKKYDREFKIEAVRLATEPGNTAAKVERDLGI
ncbi:MAG: transposase, partial [Deltaproteobacteria bacterium]|nr:transposase [Deltaproteobacteria bacterium]